ncbi:hypothetical protein GCM10023220_47630 [Streptomyces ziwulingensis]|uniref:Uncharacterized protein n=1 Tax=Streptomyces ziwulingensis TaxID=1045501 RepID=A0ABP9CHX2_9ACTN
MKSRDRVMVDLSAGDDDTDAGGHRPGDQQTAGFFGSMGVCHASLDNAHTAFGQHFGLGKLIGTPARAALGVFYVPVTDRIAVHLIGETPSCHSFGCR